MIRFATITATRSDRPELLAFCKTQLKRMNRKADKSFFVDYPPAGGDFDLTERVKIGVNHARAEGFELIFIIEDDDYYPATYFDNIPDADFIGEYRTTYYTLVHRQYEQWPHTRHSSLFTTGFKISALDGFAWPAGRERFLDVTLWKYAIKARKKIADRTTGAIGIKHNIGLCGGKGHTQRMKEQDPQMEWLRSHVDSEAFNFYKSTL